MKQSIPRIKTIRPKNGGATITVFRTPDNKSDFVKHIDEVYNRMSSAEGICGSYLLFWTEDGYVIDFLTYNGDGPYHIYMLPELARSSLQVRVNEATGEF